MRYNEIDILNREFTVGAVRDHIEERESDDNIELMRYFLLTVFDEISHGELADMYEETHDREMTKLEVELVENQRRVYNTMNDRTRDRVRNVLFYIYGSNGVSEKQAERSLRELQERKEIPSLEVSVPEFLT